VSAERPTRTRRPGRGRARVGGAAAGPPDPALGTRTTSASSAGSAWILAYYLAQALVSLTGVIVLVVVALFLAVGLNPSWSG